jgi:hypothetical protein
MRQSILLSVLMAVSMPALAIFKCESQGQFTYTDVPCSGKQAQLPPAIAPSDPDAARQRAASERSQVEHIEKDREKAQADLARQQQKKDKLALAQKKKCTLLALEKKWSEEDAAGASQLTIDKATAGRRRARQKAERYEAECHAN